MELTGFGVIVIGIVFLQILLHFRARVIEAELRVTQLTNKNAPKTQRADRQEGSAILPFLLLPAFAALLLLLMFMLDSMIATANAGG